MSILDNHTYQTGRAMLMTKRKPATVGEILVEEFMRPMGVTQAAFAVAMGVPREHVKELSTTAGI
jgi:addiction module HigA family antidote